MNPHLKESIMIILMWIIAIGLLIMFPQFFMSLGILIIALAVINKT